MMNYLTGTLVAAVVLGLGWLGLEYNAGRMLLTDRPLETIPFDDLMAMANNVVDQQRAEAIIELGFRNDAIQRQVETLASIASTGAAEHTQAADLAIQQLGDQARDQVADYFQPPLQLDDDGHVLNLPEVFHKRTQAASLIRVLGGPKCDQHFPAIEKMLDCQNSDLVRCALFALRGLPERAKQCEPKLAQLLVELPQRKDFNFNNQIAICQLAISAGLRSAAMEKAVQEMLAEGLPSVRGWCGVCLGEFGDSPSHSDNAKILAEAIERDHLLVVHQLLVGLAKLGPRAAKVRDVAIKRLDHHDRYVSVAAALAVSRIDQNLDTVGQAVQALLRQSQSQQLALDMVVELGEESPSLLDDVIPLTSNSDPIIRETVAVTLGKMGPAAKSAVLRLQPLTRDPDPLVRYAAIDAVKKIKAP